MVGAGIAGTSVAWHLAGARDVLILEQGEQPLSEASAQNAGMLRRFVLRADERRLACRTHELVTATLGPEWDGAEPFRRTGAVIALERPDSRHAATAEALREAGVRVEEPSLGTLGELAPALRGAPIASAYWLPDEGLLDAWLLGSGFLRGALDRGARLRTGTRATGLWVEHGGCPRLRGVHTSAGDVAAEVVVVATGAWSQPLAATAGLARPLLPKARHLFRSAPHALSRPDHPWCWIDDAGLYVRPEAGGFLVSPCDETDHQPAAGPGSAGAFDPLARAIALDKLERSMPALRDLRLTDGWTGLRTFTPTREFLLGPDPDLDGLYWVAGLGGAGVSCAFAIGERARDTLAPGTPARTS